MQQGQTAGTGLSQGEMHGVEVVEGVGIHVVAFDDRTPEDRALWEKYAKNEHDGFMMVIPSGKTVRVRWQPTAGYALVIVEKDARVQCDVLLRQGLNLQQQLVLESGAHCRVFEQREGGGECNLYVDLAEQSVFVRTAVVLAGGRLSGERNYYLRAPHASVEDVEVVWGKRLGDHEQKVNIVHAAPHTTSLVKVKEVLQGAARSFVHGLIRVEKTAQNASSFLSAHALLLDKDAIAQIIPALEIETADVQRAGHATAVSPLDDEHLFYLTTRGISEDAAKRILVRGFVQDVLASLEEKEQARIVELLEEQWPH